MKILVCFKVVPDLDNLTNDEWIGISKTQDLSYVKNILSCYDEAALETALSLGDDAKKLGKSLELTALTIASPDARVNNFIKNLYALNFDKVVKIICEQDLSFSSENVAELIYDYARKQGEFDAILMGRQANVGDQGVAPGYVAELLGIPLIPYTLNLELISQGISSQSMSDYVMRHHLINTPAVYALDNSTRAYLRIATLKEKMASRKKETIGINQSATGFPKVPFNVYSEKKERECLFITGESAKEKAEKLYNLYLKDVIKQ